MEAGMEGGHAQEEERAHRVVARGEGIGAEKDVGSVAESRP